MPLRLTDEERALRADEMREQGNIGRALRSRCASTDPPVRLGDIATEMGLDPESLSRYINGRRFWPEGAADLRSRVFAAFDAACERRLEAVA